MNSEDMNSVETPVALVIFRRPKATAAVLSVLKQVGARRLYVIADGPRSNHPQDIPACAETRSLIEKIDWPCKVTRIFSDDNLGCAKSLPTGLSRVFEEVDRAIILEDDCVPDPSFFPFVEEMLERYTDDKRIMHVSGTTYRDRVANIETSYHFSHFPACWGWATWRRAWNLYDFKVTAWSKLKQTEWLSRLLGEPNAEHVWGSKFDLAAGEENIISYWDYQWAFACWANSGLSIFPKSNLITNVGCGDDATHCHAESDPHGNVPTRSLKFPIIHPDRVLADVSEDRRYVQEVLVSRFQKRKKSFSQRMRSKISRHLAERHGAMKAI